MKLWRPATQVVLVREGNGACLGQTGHVGVFVHACVCERARAHVHHGVCVCVCVCVRACVRACPPPP